MLDPFGPEKAEEVERLKTIQADIHESFKTMVRDRRGDKLKADEGELFSGEFWTGRRALELGLIDGIGDVRSVMRERFGEKVRFRKIETRQPWWRRAARFSTDTPMDWPDQVIAALEARMLWARLGL